MSRQHAGSEQRRVGRVDVVADISAEISVTQPARIAEISHGGARIIVAAPLHLETIHDLTLRIGRAALPIKARIVHCRLTDTSQGRPTYVAGVEFVDLADADRRLIDAYLAGRRDAPAE